MSRLSTQPVAKKKGRVIGSKFKLVCSATFRDSKNHSVLLLQSDFSPAAQGENTARILPSINGNPTPEQFVQLLINHISADDPLSEKIIVVSDNETNHCSISIATEHVELLGGKSLQQWIIDRANDISKAVAKTPTWSL